MTVLVTGGAGYIGSHMVHELVDAGEAVVALDNLATGFDWAVAEGVPLVVGDTGDQPLVASIIAEHRIDAIIHFAASTVVPESVADPLAYYRNNTVNSRALIETAISSSPRPPRSTAIPSACRWRKTHPPCRCRPTARPS
jgi:UDP-glucose 4-epimerase